MTHITYHLIQSCIAIEAWHKEPHGVLINGDVLENATHLVKNVQQKAALGETSCLIGHQKVVRQPFQKLLLVIVRTLQKLGKGIKRIAISEINL